MNFDIWLVSIIILAFLIGFLIPNPFYGFNTSNAPKTLRYGIGNPEMIFSQDGNCFKVGKYWKGDADCYNGTIDGDIGSIMIIPYPYSGSRFVYQTFIVPKDVTKLEIKLEGTSHSSRVSRVSIEIIDHTSPPRIVYPIDSFEVTGNSGWVVKDYNITYFRGKPISLIVYVSKVANQTTSEKLAIGYIKLL